MDLIKPSIFSLMTRCFSWEKKHYLTASVFCGFSLDQPDLFFEEDAVWDLAGTMLSRFQVFDHGWPKPRGEYLAAGRCFVPGGGPAQAARASIRFGPFTKTLVVFGDRQWVSPMHGIRTQSKPLPFQAMDLSWQRAFGGPGDERNPVGVGGEAVLPNIELPDHLIASPDDRPLPAGFGPQGLDWPVRLKKLGTFDNQWLKDHWPGFPGDFDFGFFNMAPPDQQLDGYFRGDESFELHGFSPDIPVMTGRLPGLRARVFGQVGAQLGNCRFAEIKTSLDTVWFFPEAKAGVLFWRGSLRVGDDEASDVIRLGVFAEKLSQEPKPDSHYRDRMAESGEEEPLEEAEVMAEVPEAEPREPSPSETASPPAPPPPDEKLTAFLASIQARSQAVEDQLGAHFQKLGIDPDMVLEEPQPPKWMTSAPKLPDMDPQADPEEFMNSLAAHTRAVEQTLDNHLQALGIDPEAALPELPKAPDPDPEVLTRIAKLIPAGHQDLVDDLLALKQDVLQGRAFLAELAQKAEASAPEPEEAIEAEEKEEAMEAPTSTLTREEVFERYQQGRSLAGLDLSGLDLSGGNLAGADLTGSVLEKTNLSKTCLSEARLQGALLSGADLNQTDLWRADLKGISGARTQWTSANLTGADLTGADLTRADLSSAVLNQAVLDQADLTGANLSHTRGREMTAPRARLTDTKLDGADFSSSDLSRAQFDRASVNATVFSWSRLGQTSWMEAKGEATVFEGADLVSANSCGKTALPMARFSGADLSRSYWEDSDLAEADFRGAVLNGASLTRCNLQKAILHLVEAKEADLSGSDLTGVDGRFMNLFNGSLGKARLNRTDLQGANLSGVDFFKAKMDRTKLDQARLSRTLLSVWGKK